MLDRAVTQSEFAELIGVTQQAVSDLQRRGVFKPDVTGAGNLLAYCHHLREEAAGRAGELATESAALKRSQRAEVDMRVALKRRELMPVAVVSQVLAQVGRQASVKLDAIKPGIRLRAPDIGVEVMDYIEGEIAKARNLVAAMSLADLVSDDPEGDD